MQDQIRTDFLSERALLTAEGPEVERFFTALRTYVAELAAILASGLADGMAVDRIVDDLFGDRRKAVDVTFHVGANGEAVHVVGRLDYVFFDFRDHRRRIIDYKLTPAEDGSNDLFQVCIYALMHNVQHSTEADAGVVYLYPTRTMIENSWTTIFNQRYKAYNLLASMRDWIAYDETRDQGLKPVGEPLYCPRCPWDTDGECAKRLGGKREGNRRDHWSERIARDAAIEPPIAVVRPAPAPAADDDPVLPPGDACLFLGTGPSGTPVRVPIPTLNTHTAVVGAAGSGKTWLAKVIVEEAVFNGIPVVAVDPQGDLAQFLKPSPLARPTPEDRDRFEAYWHRVEPRVFTPGSSHARRIRINPLRLARLADLSEIAQADRRREEFQTMLDGAASALVTLAAAGGEQDAQRTALFQILQAHLRDASSGSIDLEQVANSVMDPPSVGLDDIDTIIRKTDREKLGRKLYALIRGPDARLFQGGDPLDLESLRTPRQAGRTPLNVIYLNALTDDARKQFFVASLAAEIYRWMITSVPAPMGGVNLLFYIDEARDFIPAGARKTPAKEPLIRLFTQASALMRTDPPVLMGPGPADAHERLEA